MDQYVSSCRVCLCFIKDPKIEQDYNENTTPIKESLVKYFFEKSTSFKILPDEPQNCCSFCYEELLQSVRFFEKCERTQRVLDGMRNEENVSDGMKLEEVGLEWNEFLDDTKPLKSSLKELTEDKNGLVKSPKKYTSKVKEKKKSNFESKLAKVICPYCAALVKSSYLESHIKYVHMEPRHSYICDLCNTQLSSKKSVIRHMNHVHLKIKNYKCKICCIQFPNEALRKAHLLQIHKVLPPKSCPYCDYRAFTKAHITRHIQRHRGDRRFKCPTCSFAFVTLLQLQTHQAVHSDERNFECDVCLKRFKTKKNLSAHKKCHLAYEYECGVCNRSFLTNQMMRNHVKKNHPDFELPPKGTVLNKEAVKRMKNIENEIRQYNQT